MADVLFTDLPALPALSGSEVVPVDSPNGDGTFTTSRTTTGGIAALVNSAGSVTNVSITDAHGLAGSVVNPTTTPDITLSTTVTGIVKGDGTSFSAAVPGTDYQSPITLTTTGSSGAATFTGNTLNVPVYAGTVTSLSVTSANGFAGSVANPTTAPAITISTTATGLLKGNGTAMSAASSGTDYSAGTAALTTGILKSTTSTGALTIAVAADFPTLNQNTTGSAAKWTTARNLAGNSVDGSANVAFANKFIVQGTVDAGLSGAQFLGTLGTGLLKNTTTTGVLSSAVAGTDYQAPITLTTTGSSGVATFAGNTLNIPNYAGGSGTVTSVSVVSANGLAGSVANATTTPAITLSATATGVLKGTGTALTTATAGSDYSAGTAALTTGILKSTTSTGALSIAAAGTDYQAPLTLTTTGSSGTATLVGNTLNVPTYISSVATRTALAALSTSLLIAYLEEAGRQGVFLWNSANLSTQVTADTTQGIYVAPASAPTGASGAWVRVFDGFYFLDWFGAKGDGTTDDAPALRAAVAVCPENGTLILGPHSYRLNSAVSGAVVRFIDKAISIVGSGGSQFLLSGLATSDDVFYFYGNTQHSGFKFTDFAIQQVSPGAPVGRNAIFIDGSGGTSSLIFDFLAARLVIGNMNTGASFTANGTGTTNGAFAWSIISDCDMEAIYLASIGDSVRVEDCKLGQSGTTTTFPTLYGYNISGATGFQARGNNLVCNAAGIIVWDGGLTPVFDANELEQPAGTTNAYGAMLYLQGGQGVINGPVVTNNVLSQNTTNAYNGIRIGNVNGGSVEHNTIGKPSDAAGHISVDTSGPVNVFIPDRSNTYYIAGVRTYSGLLDIARNAIRSSGYWEPISTTAGSGLTAVTVTNLSAFRKLRIIGELAPVGTAAPLGMQFSTDNGATWLSGASEYLRNANSVVSGPTNTPSYDANAYCYLNTIENCKVGENIAFEVEITGFNAASSRAEEFWRSIFYGTTSGNRIAVDGKGTTASTTARNALQITMSGATSFAGNVVIEGVRG